MTQRDFAALTAADQHSQLHPFTSIAEHLKHGPHIITHGKGIYIFDQYGKSFIDAFAGLYCVNIGYGRDEVAEAIGEQAKTLAYYHSYASHANEPSIILSEMILRNAPAGMSKVFYGLSGSDANDTNVKLVWHYNNLMGRPKKKKIISRIRGYHGSTVMAGSLTGLPLYHSGFDLPIPGVLFTDTPHFYWGAQEGESELEFSKRLADKLDHMIEQEGPETVAAFIAEPVMGTGGLIPPPQGYFEQVQRVLKKHDVLFICDEVVCGFGRIGSWFGALAYDIEPDFMTLAKGMTSAYLPLSASVISERVWRVLLEASPKFGTFAHGYTYTAHPTCAAAGVANLNIVERERLADNAASTGCYLLSELTKAFADHPLVGEVRGRGLLAGVELVADRTRKLPLDSGAKVAARIAQRAAEEGVIIRAMPHSDTLGFAPPLIIQPEEVDEVIKRVMKGFNRAIHELTREGAIQPVSVSSHATY
jgi:L-2,4-diaminobutyrate transaminase